MIANDVFSALADIREGRVVLTAEQTIAFLDAVQELARVLIIAPRGGDIADNAIWHAHERMPALARFADASRPGQPSLAAELEAARADEVRIVRQLRADLGPIV